MADWKKNPAVGVSAGIIFVLSIIIMFMLLKPKSYTPVKGELATPASTPMVNKTK